MSSYRRKSYQGSNEQVNNGLVGNRKSDGRATDAIQSSATPGVPSSVPASAVVGPLGANLLQKRVADVLELEEVHIAEFFECLQNLLLLRLLLLLAVRLGLCEGG